MITRAIGIFDDPELEVETGSIEPGDTFVVCSDGLTGHVADADIRDLVKQLRAQDACDSLVALTLDRGASDNVTVVVVKCHGAERTNYIPASEQDAPGPGQ